MALLLLRSPVLSAFTSTDADFIYPWLGSWRQIHVHPALCISSSFSFIFPSLSCLRSCDLHLVCLFPIDQCIGYLCKYQIKSNVRKYYMLLLSFSGAIEERDFSPPHLCSCEFSIWKRGGNKRKTWASDLNNGLRKLILVMKYMWSNIQICWSQVGFMEQRSFCSNQSTCYDWSYYCQQRPEADCCS
jgi:hypothetical protein